MGAPCQVSRVIRRQVYNKCRTQRMRRSTQIIGLLILTSLAPSAPGAGKRSVSNPLQHNEASTQGIPKDTLITLERTVCYGTCPSYKITIEANGAVTFEGRQFVKTVGSVKSTISQQRLRELLAAFDKIGYFDLRDRYNEPEDGCKQWATDNPSAITSIRINGKSKSVSHYYGCRGLNVLAELKKLEQAIDDAVDSAQWVR